MESAAGRAPSPEFPLELVILRRTMITAGVVELELGCDLPGGRLSDWRPGAHIDLEVGPDEVRQYSLCGSPSDASWLIGVQYEAQGRGGSRWVHEWQEGRRVRVTALRNTFALDTAERYLFVAGGIGITPIRPMIHDVAARGGDFRLLYGGRDSGNVPYATELQRTYGDRVTVWPQDRRGLLPLAQVLAEADAGTALYACGPSAMLAALEPLVADWAPTRVHVERFVTTPAEQTTGTPFEVELARSGITMTVGADQSILEAVRAGGARVLSSCRSGRCGTCETGVMDGVPDHRDEFLTDDERAAMDVMMICVSRSHSPRLVLDL